MLRFYSLLIPAIVFADTSIHLNGNQLETAKAQVTQNIQQAISQTNKYSQELSNINLNQLDLTSTKSEIKTAIPLLKNIKPLPNKLSTGDKYYLYSESIVTEAKQYTDSFVNHTPLDINQTINDYNLLIKNAKTKINDARLLIFISSSMPKPTIINLMSQASAIGAVFVVRGLINGSFVNTYRYFYNLKGDNTVGIMINPTLFQKLQVNTVPTFALYQSEQDLLYTSCNIVPKYTKVSGEVTVHYALEQLVHSSNSELAQIASNEIDILKNNKEKQ